MVNIEPRAIFVHAGQTLYQLSVSCLDELGSSAQQHGLHGNPLLCHWPRSMEPCDCRQSKSLLLLSSYDRCYVAMMTQRLTQLQSESKVILQVVFLRCTWLKMTGFCFFTAPCICLWRPWCLIQFIFLSLAIGSQTTNGNTKQMKNPTNGNVKAHDYWDFSWSQCFS